MSDDELGMGTFYGLSIAALAMVFTLLAMAETPKADPQLRMLQLLSAFSVALLVVGGFVCLLRMWRPFAVLLMTPLTAWNSMVSTPGNCGRTGGMEAAVLTVAQLVAIAAALLVGAVAYGPHVELTISGVVVAWVLLPTIAILIGVLCRTAAPVMRGMRRAYAETEAELYGRAADDGDERKGGLTEAGRE